QRRFGGRRSAAAEDQRGARRTARFCRRSRRTGATDLLATVRRDVAREVWPEHETLNPPSSQRNETAMDYIDPHIHMVSRITDDYETLARMGCVAMSEPAFWAGFDRGSVDGFRDYFRQLTEVEPKRAANYGLQHFTWLCINAKEAENVSLSRDVIKMIPEFIDKPNVLGIGEIGLNKNTKNESIIFQEHVELAVKFDQLILIHTPHL